MNGDQLVVSGRTHLGDGSSDGECLLVQRLKAGEEAAFEEILHEHTGRMLSVARKYLPEESDAEDVVQEAFLSAFKSIASFAGTAQLGTWLHRITVNACLMKLRTRRRRPEQSADALLPEFLEDGHQRNPSRQWKPLRAGGIEQAEAIRLVRENIAELPDQYREVLLLRDFEGLDTEEAGIVLGITSNAVKTRLHRARQALRSLLDPYFADGDM